MFLGAFLGFLGGLAVAETAIWALGITNVLVSFVVGFVCGFVGSQIGIRVADN